MSGVRKIHMNFKNIKKGFNEKSFSEQNLFNQRHKVILYISLDTRDHLEPSLVKDFKKVLRDVTFVSKKALLQMPSHLIQNSPLIYIARSNFNSHNATFMVDDQMKLQTLKPSHGCFSSGRKAFKNKITTDTFVVAHRKGRCISNINSRFFTK